MFLDNFVVVQGPVSWPNCSRPVREWAVRVEFALDRALAMIRCIEETRSKSAFRQLVCWLGQRQPHPVLPEPLYPGTERLGARQSARLCQQVTPVVSLDKSRFELCATISQGVSARNQDCTNSSSARSRAGSYAMSAAMTWALQCVLGVRPSVRRWTLQFGSWPRLACSW